MLPNRCIKRIHLTCPLQNVTNDVFLKVTLHIANSKLSLHANEVIDNLSLLLIQPFFASTWFDQKQSFSLTSLEGIARDTILDAYQDITLTAMLEPRQQNTKSYQFEVTVMDRDTHAPVVKLEQPLELFVPDWESVRFLAQSHQFLLFVNQFIDFDPQEKHIKTIDIDLDRGILFVTLYKASDSHLLML